MVVRLLRVALVRTLRLSAAVGAAVWAAWWAFGGYDLVPLVARLAAFGPLVVAPLGLAAIAGGAADDAADAMAEKLWRCAAVLQPIAAALVLVSFSQPAGGLAAALALPWLLFTALVALHGAWRFFTRGPAPLTELCLDAGCAYLVVGGVWLVAARADATLLGFHGLLVTLTATHFHHAGFAAPLLAGLSGRVLPERGAARLAWRVGAGAVIAGPPLVALGITGAPLLEVISAFVLAGGLLVLAATWLVAVRPRLPSPLARALLVVSGASLAVTMALACRFALGEWRAQPVTYVEMARWHGLGNALGFTLCGLLAFTFADPARLARGATAQAPRNGSR